MDYTMCIEQIKDVGTRTMLSDMARNNILNLKNQNLVFDKDIQERKALIAMDTSEYDQVTKKYNNREITSKEYDAFNDEFALRRDSKNIYIKSFEMKKAANEYKQKSLNFLSWFCQFRYGENMLEIYSAERGKNVLMPKEGVYNSYFKFVISQEKERLIQEHSLLCLKLNFCRRPGAISYEQYVKPDIIEKKLEDVKLQLATLQEYEQRVGDNPIEFVDINLLTVGDLMNGNSQQMFDKFFLRENEVEKKRAM